MCVCALAHVCGGASVAPSWRQPGNLLSDLFFNLRPAPLHGRVCYSSTSQRGFSGLLTSSSPFSSVMTHAWPFSGLCATGEFGVWECEETTLLMTWSLRGWRKLCIRVCVGLCVCVCVCVMHLFFLSFLVFFFLNVSAHAVVCFHSCFSHV